MVVLGPILHYLVPHGFVLSFNASIGLIGHGLVEDFRIYINKQWLVVFWFVLFWFGLGIWAMLTRVSQEYLLVFHVLEGFSQNWVWKF